MFRISAKKIRRFTDDILGKEVKKSIEHMAKVVTSSVTKKALLRRKRKKIVGVNLNKD